MHTCIIVNILLICVLASARGGHKIYIGSKSSAYMRNNPDSQWSSRYFEPVTAEMIINPDNFDIVRFEGRRVATRSSDCPTNITECYILKFKRFGPHTAHTEIDLAFSHANDFDKVRNLLWI